MKLYSELDQSTRETLGARIQQRWTQLYELDKEWSERALKYLLLTNSGGAIATLSFLGAAPAAIGMLGAKIALSLFVLGVILVGVATAKTFHHMHNLFDSWKLGVDKYYADKATWDQIQNEDDKRAGTDLWDYGIPYGAFACFIVGCAVGGWSLLTRVGP